MVSQDQSGSLCYSQVLAAIQQQQQVQAQRAQEAQQRAALLARMAALPETPLYSMLVQRVKPAAAESEGQQEGEGGGSATTTEQLQERLTLFRGAHIEDTVK